MVLCENVGYLLEKFAIPDWTNHKMSKRTGRGPIRYELPVFRH
jgi:hypothetical protein